MELITGVALGRRVYIDGIELLPTKSQTCRNHSPDGFNWGYGGSGPAQLALAIMLHYLLTPDAVRLYQEFKFDIIANLTIDHNFELEVSDVTFWIAKHRITP